MKKTKFLLFVLLSFFFFSLYGCQNEEEIEVIKEKIIITFDANGGSLDNDSLEIDKDSTTSLPTPVKQDKEFTGWYTALDESSQKVDESYSFSNSCTLYAKWNSYNIAYLNIDESTYYIEVVNDGEIAQGPNQVPTKAPDENYYYEFLGWDFDFSQTINKDYEVKSKWSQDEIIWADPAMARAKDNKTYRSSYLYHDGLFKNSASIYNQDLALFAYGLAIANQDKNQINKFLANIGCENIYQSSSYDEDPTTTSIAYSFAIRKQNDTDILFVSIRGFNYGLEWVNNFKVGANGNHTGFNDSAVLVYNDLLTYLSSYATSSNIKILITGYSRAGGVSNVLASILLESNNAQIREDNLYVYTFEAPRGLSSENAKPYPNVFNIINSADIVTYVAPAKYGLFRCGIDIDIYKKNVSTLLKGLDVKYVLPNFVAKKDTFNTEIDFVKYIITELTNYNSGTYPSSDNRFDFNRYYQSAIEYTIYMLISLKDETIANISNDIQAKDTSSLITMLANDNLYNYLKPFIDNDGISYNPDELKQACSSLAKYIGGPAKSIITTSVNYSSNLSRMMAMHDPIVNYCFLINYK